MTLTESFKEYGDGTVEAAEQDSVSYLTPYMAWWDRSRYQALEADMLWRPQAYKMTGMQLLAMAGADRTRARRVWQQEIVNRTWIGNHRYTK